MGCQSAQIQQIFSVIDFIRGCYANFFTHTAINARNIIKEQMSSRQRQDKRQARVSITDAISEQERLAEFHREEKEGKHV